MGASMKISSLAWIKGAAILLALLGAVSLLVFVVAFPGGIQEVNSAGDVTGDVTVGESTAPADAKNDALTADLELHPALKERRYDAAIRDIVCREDPRVDGWSTESFSETAAAKLKQVGKLLVDDSIRDARHVGSVFDSGFRSVLRPKVRVVFEDSTFQVRREADVAGSPADSASSAVEHQAAAIANSTDRRFKFKIIRVELGENTAKTLARFSLVGAMPAGSAGSVQVSATWECDWVIGDDEIPFLASVVVTDYEEVTAKQPQLFVDCTRSMFSGVDVLESQLQYGRDHWYGTLEGSIGVEGRGNGIAIGDANGDGLDDVYVCQPAALPNRLFIRQPDGSLREAASEANVDWLDSTRAALIVDMDNDGDQDLVLTQSTSVLIHENDGRGIYSLRATIPSVSRLFSINALDYDGDHDLDLFVCGYSGATQIRPDDIFASPVPYHDANNGAPNTLLRNNGEWDFSDVTADVGLQFHNFRFSLASTWEDFDNDGDLDLYVANDFGRNNLYRNDGGRFVDIAQAAGVEDIGPGMAASWGDYNNDGLADLYVSNMFSSAGSRITHTAQFKPGTSAADLAGFRRHARGNSLFKNNGDGTFTDEGVPSGTTLGRWAWGSLLTDVNNDGWRDVYVTNGFVTADNNNDL